MPKSDSLSTIGYLTAGLLIFVVQTYLLWYSGFFDYDSARNWQIVQEIGKGNFEHLFQHASPTFFLFYAVFASFFPDFHFYLFLNCFFNVLAILLIVHFVAQQISLPAFSTFLLLLFTGFSSYLTANSRYFTIEAPSLLLFALLLPIYYKRFTVPSSRAFLQAVGLLALGVTINYKFLLLIPIALVIELTHPNKVVRSRYFIYSVLILLLPFVVYSVVAVLVALPFYRFPAVYISLFHNFNVPTPGSRLGFFNLDVSYYLRYILRFESPLLLAGLVLFPFFFRQQIFNRKLNSPINIYRYLFLIAYLFLAGMHVLQKAPRGLFFIYSILYAITFISCAHLLRNRIIVVSLICLSIIYQGFVLNREIYAYAPTNYPQVITYLQQQKITKVATAVGLGIVPFAHTANIEVTSVFNEMQLPALKAKGYRYVLLDDYYLAANIRKFGNLEAVPPLATWPEPSLLPPFLYLDQSEFTGFSYKRALQSQRQAAQDSVQLRLLRIP